jgi:hypothetical protein
MKLLEFTNEELNFINVCLDHYIEDQNDGISVFEEMRQQLENTKFHEGKGWKTLNYYSDVLGRFSTAVGIVEKLRKQGIEGV